MQKRVIPGINIQWPWSSHIASGKKIIETRSYDIPEKHRGRELALIETPGPNGRRDAAITSARIIGVIIFEKSYRYKNLKSWKNDANKHLVPLDDPNFKFDPLKPKWAWEVKSFKAFSTPIKPPKKRGIIFANSCKI